jgi:hypothetical protein
MVKAGMRLRRAACSAAFLAVPLLLVTSTPVLQAQSTPAETEFVEEHYTTASTEIGVLLDDPAARAVLGRHLPSIAQSDRTPRTSTLKALQGYGLSTMTDEVLARIDADLAKLPPVRRPAGSRPASTTDEAKVRSYTLPDPLIMANGTRVTDAATWRAQRRPEILENFERLQYGRAPGRPAEQRFEVFDKGTPALGGKALRRQATIHLAKDPAAPTIQLVEYLPANAAGPVPMLLMIGFSAPSATFDDPGIRPSLVWDAQTMTKVAAGASPGGKIDITPFLDAGIGVTSYYYGDVEPDFAAGYPHGIRSFYAKGAPQPTDGWGAVAAWAWSLSRVQDYLETDPAVDAKRVAIFGASRLGKAALWAGARDERFRAVIACCSGKGGAALMRRNYGGTIAGDPPGGTDYWWAGGFRQFPGKEDSLPMDTHMLLALIAPRAVLLQTGKYDHAADPRGEFLAALAAEPVYELLGKKGLDTRAWPPAGPILNDIGYTMNEGGHGIAPGDWTIYRAFLEKHLHSSGVAGERG